jgi:hypothetical protein
MSAEARATIRRLRTGVVPMMDIEHLSVGYGKAKQTADEAFDALLAGNRPRTLFIRGEWGTGKTHFLSFIRGAAVGRGFATTTINLNARSAALNFPQRFYLALMDNLRVHTHAGLRPALGAALLDSEMRARITSFARSGSAGDIGWALGQLSERYEAGNALNPGQDAAWAYLSGADLAWADYAYKKEQAIARIGAISRLMVTLGYDGIVVTFDEAETLDQLWNIRSRLSAYGVLGQLCQLQSLWCVFGITERFERTVSSDIDRGVLSYEFMGDDASWFLRSWGGDRFTRFEPPQVDRRNARTLAGKVLDLYGDAYGVGKGQTKLVDRSVEEWMENPSRNPRRLIRALIHQLDRQRPLVDSWIPKEMASDLVAAQAG